MDLALLAGWAFAFVMITVAVFVLAKANLMSYISVDSMMITLGGTIGATWAGVTMKQSISSFRAMKECFIPPKINWATTINEFVEMATIARREGVILLQDKIDNVDNDLIKNGLQLIVDGADSDILSLVVGTRIDMKKADDRVNYEIFGTLGIFSPAFGLLGTVLGLIMVLGNLKEPEKLGTGIAQAFLTTLYGIILSNLVFLPMANKIKGLNQERSRYYEMIMTGLESIHEGDNPLLLEEKLKAFCPDVVEKPSTSGEEEVNYGQGLQTEAS